MNPILFQRLSFFPQSNIESFHFYYKQRDRGSDAREGGYGRGAVSAAPRSRVSAHITPARSVEALGQRVDEHGAHALGRRAHGDLDAVDVLGREIKLGRDACGRGWASVSGARA